MANRDAILRLLGGEVGALTLTVADTRSQVSDDGWVTENLVFAADHGEPIPAWFVRPERETAPTVPAILYCHAHGNAYDIGRRELFDGRPALQGPYASDLRDLGCAVLCLEMPCFGERQAADEPSRSKALHWYGRTLYGRMLAELVAGIDFLAAHPAVDADRIGVMGISMGGTHAWWLAALDERVRAAVQMCCFADLGCLIEAGNHDGHGVYMTVPGLLAECSTGELAGLAAPRAQLVAVGMQDWSSPEVCFGKARAELEAAYRAADAADALEFHIEPDAGHEETAAMRRSVLEFLKRRLVGRG